MLRGSLYDTTLDRNEGQSGANQDRQGSNDFADESQLCCVSLNPLGTRLWRCAQGEEHIFIYLFINAFHVFY